VRPKGLGELKNSMNSSGFEPAPYRLEAYELPYRVPHCYFCYCFQTPRIVLQQDIEESALCERRDSIFLGTAGALSQLPCSVPHCLRTSSLPIVALVHLFADGWKLSKLWILTLRPSSLAFKPFSIESPLTVKQSCGAAFHAELSVNGAGGSASVFPLSPPEPERTLLVTKAPLLQTYMP
jgi:hypothetical protein